MLLYVTESPNDDDLAQVLGSAAIRCPIPHGDVTFFGVDDGGEPSRICVERKRVPDMASCVLTNRYLAQAQAAKDAGFDVLILILEGRYHPAPSDGLLEIPGYDRERDRPGWKPVTPTITFSRFDQYLSEIQSLASIIFKHTETVRETAAVVNALWVNYQTPPSEHTSLKAIYKPKPPTTLLAKPSFIRRVASELPGIGWLKSQAIVGRFPTVKDMVEADVADWIKLEGIGKKTAEKIVRALRGGCGDT